MRDAAKSAVYDKDLGLEAYRFRGLARPFPNHFHEHYVIGLVEEGQRKLSCKGRTCRIGRGHILLFGPGDSHACAQSGAEALDYRGLSVSRKAMLDWAEEATGERSLPVFSSNAVRAGELVQSMRMLHELVMGGAESFEKEEVLLLLLSGLLRRYAQFSGQREADCPQAVERARAFIEQRYAERIGLERICRHAGLSKSTLLRSFARTWGVTPYRYLESVRIDRAKGLLAQGVPLPEAALRVGFSDQSHFTNYFTRFTGLPPGAYRDMFRAGGGAGAHEED